jgi:hypothetical protein
MPGPDRGGLEVAPGASPRRSPSEGDDGFEIPEGGLPACRACSPNALRVRRCSSIASRPHRTLPTHTTRFALVVWMKAA